MKINTADITPRQKLIIAKGLLDYQYIMENRQAYDADFRAVYYDFYLKARWAVMNKQENSDAYFKALAGIKSDAQLMDVLRELKNQTQSYEFSLVTKMLHTRDASKPIYDSKVREYLSREEGVKFWWKKPNRAGGAPRGTTEEEKIEHDWKELCGWYDSFKNQDGKVWIEWFDNNFPEHKNISGTKKIDFIIFAAESSRE